MGWWVADLSDVEQALVACLSAALYPDGAGEPGAISVVCRIFRGWPVSAGLEADLAQGVANVSVFPLPGGRRTTRWSVEESSVAVIPTLQVSVVGNSATFSGAGGAGQLAGILVGGQSYVYRGQSGDTLNAVAAALAGLIGSSQRTLVLGPTLMLPDAVQVVARVGADTGVMQELRRQEQRIRISVWSGSPEQRDLVSETIDVALAGVDFLPLADGSFARLQSAGGAVLDGQEASALYRRDLVFLLEYATTRVVVEPPMLFGDLSFDQEFLIS